MKMTTAELETLHWSQLKKLVEESGGKYESKAQAIAHLSTDSTETTTQTARPAGNKLDRSSGFGVISGEVEECPTARYSQGGNLYDIDGNKV